MSVLEIIIYTLLATGAIVWIATSIISMKKKKKKGSEEDED